MITRDVTTVYSNFISYVCQGNKIVEECQKIFSNIFYLSLIPSTKWNQYNQNLTDNFRKRYSVNHLFTKVKTISWPPLLVSLLNNKMNLVWVDKKTLILFQYKLNRICWKFYTLHSLLSKNKLSLNLNFQDQTKI